MQDECRIKREELEVLREEGESEFVEKPRPKRS